MRGAHELLGTAHARGVVAAGDQHGGLGAVKADDALGALIPIRRNVSLAGLVVRVAHGLHNLDAVFSQHRLERNVSAPVWS